MPRKKEVRSINTFAFCKFTKGSTPLREIRALLKKLKRYIVNLLFCGDLFTIFAPVTMLNQSPYFGNLTF